MLTKENLVQKIKKIMDEGKSVQEELLEFLNKETRETIEDYENAKSSLNELVGGALEAVQEMNLGRSGRQIDEFIIKYVDAILNSVKGVTSDAMEGAVILADKAKENFDRAIQAAGGELEGVEEKVRKEMEDAYRALAEKAEVEQARLREAEEAVREFMELNTDKLSAEARAGLDETVTKSRQYIKEIEEKASEHIENILRHSDEKVNNWLKSLKK